MLAVAQLAERQIVSLDVAGSTPVGQPNRILGEYGTFSNGVTSIQEKTPHRNYRCYAILFSLRHTSVESYFIGLDCGVTKGYYLMYEKEMPSM